MRIHEFGTEHEKTVLLLHSACLSWRMFQPAAERLQTRYHLIIPALPAHDPDEKTPYTSVEAIAAELGDWLAQRGISTLWGLYGVSMGGAVAPRWLTRGFSLRNYLVIRFAQRHLALIRRAFPAQRFGQAAVEDVCMILGRMDRRDVWHVFDSCFHYPLPKRLQTAARVSYWYGSKEYFQRALDIRHVRRLLPETAFVAFPDCAHAEFVAGQPEAFAARLAETLELDGSDI